MAGMRALLPGLLAILPYCSAQYADFSIPSTYTNWDNAGWELSTDRLIQGQYQSRAPMGNGYVGHPWNNRSIQSPQIETV